MTNKKFVRFIVYLMLIGIILSSVLTGLMMIF